MNITQVYKSFSNVLILICLTMTINTEPIFIFRYLDDFADILTPSMLLHNYFMILTRYFAKMKTVVFLYKCFFIYLANFTTITKISNQYIIQRL